MAKRGSKKIEERAIEVAKGTSVDDVVTKVKEMSGFEAALPIRAALAAKNQVEWEFLVGNSETELKSELMARQLEAAQANQ
jgi:hypothetical protein